MASLFADFRVCVKQDVGHMNAEADERRWPRFTYLPDSRTEHVFTVERGADSRSGKFEYRPEKDDILVLMATDDRLVKTRWDAEAVQCCIVVASATGEPLAEFPHDQLWKAVQYLLEPLFFPSR